MSLTGYNWKNESVGAVVDREISSAPTSTEIKVDFTADKRLRIMFCGLKKPAATAALH